MSNYKMNKGKRTKAKAGNKKEFTSSRDKSGNPRGDKFDAKTATNNPAWYATDAALLRDSASIPFNWAVGTPINLHNPATTNADVDQTFAVPGICAALTVPAIGRADDPSDPVNTAAFAMYSYVRHLNSGHANYDAPDLMLYVLAMSQVYSYINYLQRAYGVLNTYAQSNRYMPDHLLYAMYIDANDLRNNLAAFRYGINTLINKAASLCVPATMSILARHSAMYQNIYVEGPSLKDQLYMYTPFGFWKYTLNSDASGMLEFSMIADGTIRGVDELLEYGNDMLGRIIMSEDLNIMSGDIRKAYGDNIIKLTPLPTDYMLAPVYDLAVLQQFKNTTCPGYIDHFNVVQDPSHGWLKFQPTITLAYAEDNYKSRANTYLLQTAMEDKILTVQTPSPTPEEVMESTRNMLAFSDYVRAENGLSATMNVHPGSDMVVMILFHWLKFVDGTPTKQINRMYYYHPLDVSDAEVTAKALQTHSIMSNFKYHPANHVMCYRPGDTTNAFQIGDGYMLYDVDNYAILNNNEITRMHEAALLSMLNVPSIVKVQ